MWGSLVVLALLTTINPMRIGIVLLVLTRARPIRNLLAYWVGAAIVGLVTMIVPLIVLHSTPSSASFLQNFARPTANPAAQHTAIGVGALLLSIGALIAVRSLRPAPHRARHSMKILTREARSRTSNTNTSTMVLESSAPSLITGFLNPAEDAATEGGSTGRRLLGRIRESWKNGSPWISFGIGILILPPVDGVLFALAIILASGATLEVQLITVIAYTIGVLLVEEIILVSNVVAPAKTQAALRRLHDWARAHHQKFLAAILILVGLSLVLRGMGYL
jgi:Sap, sulfolipid-1-addressing protein